MNQQSSFDLAASPHGRRILVRCAGEDVRRFLQGILSADVEALRPGQARPAALLTVKGKIVTEVILLGLRAGGLALALPADAADEALALLERHVIMDDVTLTRDDAASFVMVWPAPIQGPEVECLEATYPAPGWLAIGTAAALGAALGEARATDLEGWTLRRIEAGAPGWGEEIKAGVFPPEAGFVAAVSYDKGCFMGQEPLARIHARGQVNRVLVRVRAAACPPAALDLAAPDRPEAGRWTTWARDPAGGALGLAIVHRAAAQPGATLSAEGIGAVTVISGPLGDDPGVPGKRRA